MKLIVCSFCNSEIKLKEHYVYCKHCGKPLINKCSKLNCNKDLDNDAAFCPYCGYESKLKIKNLVHSSINDFPDEND